MAQYLVYDLTPSLQLATRGEYLEDIWEITQTFSYKIPEVTGLIARLEYRHDNSDENVFTNNNFVDPATGQQHLWRGQDTVDANFVYAF